MNVHQYFQTPDSCLPTFQRLLLCTSKHTMLAPYKTVRIEGNNKCVNTAT